MTVAGSGDNPGQASGCQVCTAPTSGFVCKPCTLEVERAIGDMPSLMHEVSLVATKQTRVYRANRRQSEEEAVADWDVEQERIPAWLRSREGRITLPTTAMMVNLGARELLWIAGNTLSTWARHMAESRGAEGPQSPADLVGWLLRNIDAVRWDELGGEIHDEVTHLHQQMTRAVDRSPSRLFAGPCHAEQDGPRCQRDLYAWPSADEITCDGWSPRMEPESTDTGCRAVHTTAERREWLLDTLEGALLGLDEMFAALPSLFPEVSVPPRSVVTAWIRQGRLMAHGQTAVGEPTYVGGELLTLVRAYRPHRFAPRRKRSVA